MSRLFVKIMAKFGREKDELLIGSVKMYKRLYDANDKNFKNNISKHKCWEKISAIVGFPVAECKKRWKSLRDQYNKKRKGESTSAERTNSNWEYMSLMSFLSDTTERHETNDNYNDPLRYAGIEFVKEENSEEEEQLEQQSVNVDASVNIKEIAQNIQHGTKRNFPQPMTRIMARRHAQRSAFYEKRINKVPKIKTPMQKFFESMADIVDKLPPQLQAEVRLKVCQIVTETELKHHSHHDPLNIS